MPEHLVFDSPFKHIRRSTRLAESAECFNVQVRDMITWKPMGIILP
jgi:hypothetical protein